MGHPVTTGGYQGQRFAQLSGLVTCSCGRTPAVAVSRSAALPPLVRTSATQRAC